MIRCEGVAYAYPNGARALNSIDLEIGFRERVAIVGPNGSGKSTLAQLWNGLLRPSAGLVRIDGIPTTGRRVADLSRTVGIAFQDADRQVFARTCRDEVAFGGRNVGLHGSALDDAVAAALDAVGLADAADRNPHDLGRPRRKLLAIASVLAMRTPVVVFDEPTIGQDAHGIARIQAIVGDLTASVRTVVAISHDARFVAETFGRAIRLEAGRVVADEPLADPRLDEPAAGR